MSAWRLLETGARGAAENIALDDVLLDGVARGVSPNTIRFLQFSPAAALIGFHQDVDQEIRVDYCKAKGIDINRRLTGGGAVYFTPNHLGWEIIARPRRQFSLDIHGLYELICGGVAEALRNLGLNACFRPRNDIEVNGRKISGTGGVERGEAFLFQGTLLTSLDVMEMMMALRIPLKKISDKSIESVSERVTTLERELGFLPSVQKIKESLASKLASSLEADLKPGELRFDEEKRLSRRLSFFSSDEWVHAVRSPKAGHFHSMAKTPGGLIRASLSLSNNIIQAVYLTGDFFVYPQRAIYDLESSLKFTPAIRDEISEVVHNFFQSRFVEMLGVEPRDIVQVMAVAVEKSKLVRSGFSVEEADKLMEVIAPVGKLIEGGFDALLLPYCAKPISCEYRGEEVCAKCGECPVGDLYELAEQLRMHVTTITDYENLQKVLQGLKRRGARAFLGSCCSAFYEKHYKDLAAVGLPGLLVDLEGTTCYEVGQESLAYEGRFEGESSLCADLISKIVKRSRRPRWAHPIPRTY